MSDAFFSGLAERFRELEQPLNALDAATGDGDHGAAMRRGLEAVAAAEPGSAAQAFRGAAGGASGTLFGALVGGLEAALAGDRDLPSALAHAAGHIAKLGMAKRGDKTMLDALIPAAEAAKSGTRRCRRAGGGASRRGRSGGDGRDGGEAWTRAVRRERRGGARGRGRAVRGGDARRARTVHDRGSMKKLVNAPERIRRRHDRRLRGRIPGPGRPGARIRASCAARRPRPPTARPRF